MNLSLSNLLRTFIIIATISIAACKKEDNTVPGPPEPPIIPPPVVVFTDVQVTASLQGRVLDESGKPVEGVTIKAGNNTKTSDINGSFRFDNIQLGKNAGSVSAEKEGYFKAGRTFVTNTGAVNYVEIQLIPKIKKGDFNSSAGGNINTGDGSSVSFEANSIINVTGNSAYSGTVNVKAAYLDPVRPNLSSIMPGNLMGLNTSGELKQLQTYGMVAIELEGGAGEKLNIATGKTATLTMPVPPSLTASAPDTIPLWYFNDTTGLWKQQGYAVKQGSNYIGTVSHFSFWNCDVPQNVIRLTMTLKGQANQALARYKVVVTDKQFNIKTYGITDSMGVVSGFVPKNASLKIEVFNDCNSVLYSQDAGPYTTDKDLGEITVTIPISAAVTISGIVKNCSNEAVTNGYVQISLDGRYTAVPVTDGSFSVMIPRCSSSPVNAELYAIDLDALQQSDTISVLVSGADVNAGILKACDNDLAQYVMFEINGLSIHFDPVKDSITAYRSGTSTMVDAGSRTAFDSLNYQSAGFTFKGTAAPNTIHTLDSASLYLSKGMTNYRLKNSTTVTITEYGGLGQFAKGSFTGSFLDINTNVVVSGSCIFRVRRY